MIDALFGSKTRVKLLHLFMNHPGQSFYVREITRLIDEQINSVRRELSNMLEVGVITSDSADNKLFYQVNQNYEFYPALRSIFANQPIKEDGAADSDLPQEDTSPYSTVLSAVPALRLAILAGSLVKGSSSPVDILFVGNVTPAKAKGIVDSIERAEGRDINFSVLPYDEFYYRLSVRDRFITEILSSKRVIAVDKDNVLGQK